MLNSIIGIAWQMSMVVMPIYLVIREYQSMIVSIAVFVSTSFLLKIYWYDKLED